MSPGDSGMAEIQLSLLDHIEGRAISRGPDTAAFGAGVTLVMSDLL